MKRKTALAMAVVQCFRLWIPHRILLCAHNKVGNNWNGWVIFLLSSAMYWLNDKLFSTSHNNFIHHDVLFSIMRVHWIRSHRDWITVERNLADSSSFSNCPGAPPTAVFKISRSFALKKSKIELLIDFGRVSAILCGSHSKSDIRINYGWQQTPLAAAMNLKLQFVCIEHVLSYVRYW